MKIYTIQDKDGNLYPKAIIEVSKKAKAVRDGKVVEMDYGFEAVADYIAKQKGDFKIVACTLEVISE